MGSTIIHLLKIIPVPSYFIYNLVTISCNSILPHPIQQNKITRAIAFDRNLNNIMVSMKYAAFIVAVCALLGEGDAADCNRVFNPPPPDDCTTFMSGAADEIPCYVYENGVPVALEFPQEK